MKEIEWQTMEEHIKTSEAPGSRVLIEYKHTGNSLLGNQALEAYEREAEQRYVPMLASLLAVSGQDFFATATLPTLPFKGYARDPAGSKGQFVFAFDYPPEAAVKIPLTLHGLILSGEGRNKLALDDRFHVAKVISRSLGSLHEDRWLHKSIRSHAI
ncbi:hypothetical protein B0J14DRAFT_165090 [Halenospora varia]|nr:hypothetical protein B0J14DRAFT_165090 [Halenospora varia]